MRKLRSWGFRKCGTFGSCELLNGSYCCSKSTDFEIFGLSPKIRGVKKKELPQFWVFGYETNSMRSPPYELPWLFVSSQKNQNWPSVIFFTPPNFRDASTFADMICLWPAITCTPKKYHILGNLRTRVFTWPYPGKIFALKNIEEKGF